MAQFKILKMCLCKRIDKYHVWPHLVIIYYKHKHPELHTSERTIVPRTVGFRLGTLVPNYICPKLLIKLCHYSLVSYVRNKYPEIYLFQITNMGESLFLGWSG